MSKDVRTPIRFFFAGELLSAFGRCQVPQHHYQRRYQHRVQDQRQQHPRGKWERQVCWTSVFQAKDQHQQLGPLSPLLKTTVFIFCSMAHAQKQISAFTPFYQTCVLHPGFRGGRNVCLVVRWGDVRIKGWQSWRYFCLWASGQFCFVNYFEVASIYTAWLRDVKDVNACFQSLRGSATLSHYCCSHPAASL